MLTRIKNAPYAMMAAATLALLPSEASAAVPADGSGSGMGIGGVADKLKTQVDSVGKLVVIGAFLIGVILIGAGLLKLKQAADTQGQQVKYGEGLWRLVVGAGLVALPAVTGVLTASFGLDAASVQIGTMF